MNPIKQKYDTMFYRSSFRKPIRVVAWSLVFAFSCCYHAGQAPADDSLAAGDRSAATTFIVVRHAERDGNRDALSPAGKERASVLRALGKILNASTVYSTNTQRTKNTVKPLADDLHLEIKRYGIADQAWIDRLRQQHAGDVVLIVGHSNTAGVIAGLLASQQPFLIGHDEYDSVFIVTTGESGTSCVRLKYGRSTQGAPAVGADGSSR